MVKIESTITFDTNGQYPDEKNAKGLEYTDTYTFDTRLFAGDIEDMREYIKGDMALVAGGGYETNTITNVKFSFRTL